MYERQTLSTLPEDCFTQESQEQQLARQQVACRHYFSLFEEKYCCKQKLFFLLITYARSHQLELDHPNDPPIRDRVFPSIVACSYDGATCCFAGCQSEVWRKKARVENRGQKSLLVPSAGWSLSSTHTLSLTHTQHKRPQVSQQKAALMQVYRLRTNNGYGWGGALKAPGLGANNTHWGGV